jgi:hypothetical protein
LIEKDIKGNKSICAAIEDPIICSPEVSKNYLDSYEPHKDHHKYVNNFLRLISW